jgi:hypothetical protein
MIGVCPERLNETTEPLTEILRALYLNRGPLKYELLNNTCSGITLIRTDRAREPRVCGPRFETDCLTTCNEMHVSESWARNW